MRTAQAGSVEMAGEELEQAGMGSQEILSMLLLLMQCIPITGSVFFFDKEGIRVPKNVSAASYYMPISLLT
jgi:hypothetical protein